MEKESFKVRSGKGEILYMCYYNHLDSTYISLKLRLHFTCVRISLLKVRSLTCRSFQNYVLKSEMTYTAQFLCSFHILLIPTHVAFHAASYIPL